MRRYAKRFMRGFLFLNLLFACVVMCGCSPTEVTAIEVSITAVEGILAIVATVGAALDPLEAGAITSAANLITQGLNALLTTVKGYLANPGTTPASDVTQAIVAVQANLPQLEAAAQVKDPTTAKDIALIAASVSSMLSLVKSWILGLEAKQTASADTTSNSAS